jgi:uncharacterized membrane protein YphA (DoxX/SURF4 family)
MLPPSTRYAGVLAVFRIYVGIFWFIHGFGKLTSGKWTGPSGGFVGDVQDMLQGSAGPYHDFVSGFVLPHAAVFAQLVCWGETLTGVALILGLLTRLGGAGGVFLALNYALLSGDLWHINGYAGFNAAAIAMSAVNLALPTGLVCGLDALIAARKRPAA